MAEEVRTRIASGVRMVTTNLVVAETHAFLLRRAGRDLALQFLREVRREPLVVEHSTPDLEDRAVEGWLTPLQGKEISLVHAVSFAVMEARGIREVLALDQAFAHAGFTLAPATQR
jgi:predicted nucleic acid-binding protein